MSNEKQKIAEMLRDRADGRNTVICDESELMRKAADLLDPPKYPCNGEKIEFRTKNNDVRCIGYAAEHGIKDRISDSSYFCYGWDRVRNYRIIREQHEIIPHPDEWPADVDMIEVGIRSVWRSGKSGWRSTNFFIIRKLAEEIWREI